MKRLPALLPVLCLAIALLISCARQPGVPSTESINTPLVSSPTRLVPSTAPATASSTSTNVFAPQVISIENAGSLAEVRRLTEHDDDIVTVVAFSPDGRLLATGGNGDNVRLWDPNTGALLAVLQGHGDNICHLAFSPDGKILATGSADDTVRLWSTTSLTTIAILEGHSEDVGWVAFSPDGRWLASGGHDDQVIIWDMQTLNPAAHLSLPGPVNSAVFNPDGSMLAVVLGEGPLDIFFWNVPEFSQAKVTSMPDRINELAYSPDGRILAIAMQSKTDPSVHLLLPASDQTAFLLSGAHTVELNSVTFSPGGRLVASTSADMSVALWDAGSGRLLTTLFHDSNANYVAFSPDGTLLATAGSDRTVRIWGVPPAEVSAPLLTQTAAALQTKTPTPTGIAIAIPNCDGGFSRLAIGQAAVVGEGELPIRVRSEPLITEDNIIALVYPGTVGLVIAGPVCVDELVFWKIENETIPNGAGWAAEGDGIDHWLEPYTP